MSQPSSVVFACNTASLGTKLHVSMGPSPHLWFCACKSATLAHEILFSIGPSPHLWFLHSKQQLLDQHTSLYKTAWWAPELPVSMCPSSHLWFLIAKQRILDSNYKSPCVPDLICGFCLQNIDFWTSIQVSMGTRHNLTFYACKTAWLAPELPVSMCPIPHLWFLHAKQHP